MAHFKNTYKPARFFFMDVRVGVILLATMLHVRLYTGAIDVIAIGGAWYVERLGMTIPGALRAVRAWVAGPYRPAQLLYKIREKTDFEYVRLPWQPERETGVFELQEVVIVREAGLNTRSSKASSVQAKK